MSPSRFCILISGICILTSSEPAGGCTIGAFGPGSTADGRPILWKNRDVKNENQEMLYVTGAKYRFVANVYAGETLDVWAGINEAGFAIMNSNSFNIGGKGGSAPDATDADDGNVMRLALSTCATVGDFAVLMNMLNAVGRETPANYGVFDATGKTAIFEAANTYYRRYDADQESLDILVRANYSYHGDTTRQTGRGRHDRAWQLVAPAAREHRITPEFIADVLARDMGSVNFDPYPLPFYGTVGHLPFGYIPGDTSICRAMTRSTEIMVGPKPGEDPATGMMWVLLGPPEGAVAVPLWVRGGQAPEMLNGPERARLCDEAIALRTYTRSNPDFPEAANTFSLYRIHQSLLPAESANFAMVRSHEPEWPSGPSAAEAQALTVQACRNALDATDAFWQQLYEPGPETIVDTGPGLLPTITRGRLCIQLPRSHPSGAGPTRVRICDVLGRVMTEFLAGAAAREVSWDAAGLAAGRYFVMLPDLVARPAGFVVLR